MDLSMPLKGVLRTTKDHLRALEEMDIRTVEDLLMYLPRAHEDLSQVQTIKTAPLDSKVTLRGGIDKLKLVRTRKGKKLVTGKLIDTEGDILEVVWFNQPHIMRMLSDGDDVVLTGKLIENGYKLQLQSPQFERELDRPLVHAGRIVPIYPQHDRINTMWLREKMVLVKEAIEELPETLPQEVLDEEDLMPRCDTIRALHFPDEPEQVKRAWRRIVFEEMYRLQEQALLRKMEWQGQRQDRLRIPMDVELIKAFFASLNFTPTDCQKIAIYEILKDMEKDKPMSRLLEGDVGSGKTLVSVAIMANVVRHGGQCALMVPTEVLAKQHVESIAKVLFNFHSFLVKEAKEANEAKEAKDSLASLDSSASSASFHCPSVALLTGSTPKSEAKRIKQGLVNGTIDIVIGTHALIVDNVEFQDLKIVIVDEQHRFGVQQRERLKEKGSPHFMSMTATPIPRTLALTAHGHHDLSVLIEKPGNRQVVDTKVVPPDKRRTVEGFIDVQINQGRQVFVICPLINESSNEEMAEIKSVEQEVKRLKEGFPHRCIAMLHGKMTPSEKEETMKKFKDKEYDILVSTSVIEVGIDIPNSSIIVIEGSERFGLAQLHQFRGRVGRGDHKSYCFLFTTTPEQARSPRLKAMEQHDSGFTLAEIDLKIRGPGELFGLRQSGIPEDFATQLLDPKLVVRARRWAERFVLGKEIRSV